MKDRGRGVMPNGLIWPEMTEWLAAVMPESLNWRGFQRNPRFGTSKIKGLRTQSVTPFLLPGAW
jgi:hypothetical protein